MEAATGFEALRAYLPWLSREGVPPPRGREEGRPVRPPGDRPAADPRGDRGLPSPRHGVDREGEARPCDRVLRGHRQHRARLRPFAPPRQPTVSEEDYARYSGVPELYFRHVDTLLGAYRALAEERGAVLVLASDHGFFWGEGRPKELSSFATRPPASGTARRASTSRGVRASLPPPATPTAPARRRSRPPCCAPRPAARPGAGGAGAARRPRPRRQGRPLRRALPAGHSRRDGERRDRRRGDREAEGPRLHRRRRGHVGPGRGGGEHAHGRLVEQRGARAARRGPEGGLRPRLRERSSSTRTSRRRCGT